MVILFNKIAHCKSRHMGLFVADQELCNRIYDVVSIYFQQEQDIIEYLSYYKFER